MREAQESRRLGMIKLGILSSLHSEPTEHDEPGLWIAMDGVEHLGFGLSAKGDGYVAGRAASVSAGPLIRRVRKSCGCADEAAVRTKWSAARFFAVDNRQLYQPLLCPRLAGCRQGDESRSQSRAIKIAA